MVEKTLICFLVFAQPDIETGEPSPSSNIELVCMEEDEEAILDVPESSENESLNLGEVNESGIFSSNNE